jgi:hypothetical protein
MFNEGKYWERAQAGEFQQVITYRMPKKQTLNTAEGVI